MPASKNWTPYDFVVEGTYCHPEAIESHLRKIVRENKCNAENAILFAAHKDHLFKSLVTLSERRYNEPRNENTLRAHLQEHFVQKRRREANLPIADAFFDEIGKIKTFADMLASLGIPPHPTKNGLHCRGATRQAGAMRLALFLFSKSGTPTPSQIPGKAWELLESQISCTVFYVERNRHDIERACDNTARSVEQEIDRLETLDAVLVTTGKRGLLDTPPQSRETWTPCPNDKLCKKFLQHLCEETDSDYASFHGLLRQTREIATKPFEEFGKKKSIDPKNRLERISDAFRRSMPHIRSQRCPDGRMLDIGFPVAYRRYKTSAPDAMGVIYLQKTIPTSESVFYSTAEMEHMRTVSMHMRRHHDWLLLRQSSTFLANVNRSARLPVGDEYTAPEVDPNQCFDEGDIFEQFDLDPLTLPILPIEVEQSSAGIREVMAALYQLTRARSVALRVLTTDSSHLIRCISLYGDVKLSGWIAKLSDGCATKPNVGCVMYEQPVDLPNVHKIPVKYPWLKSVSFARDPDPISALYCTPVRCQGTVIGTLNVESVYLDAFTVSKSVVDAFAAQIGHLVESARANNERLLHISSDIGDIGHGAENWSQTVTEAEALINERTGPEFSRFVSNIKHRAKKFRNSLDRFMNPITTHSNVNSLTLREVLDNYKTEWNLDRVVISDSPSMMNRPFTKRHQLKSLHNCLRELLDNAIHYAQKSRHDTANVRVYAETLRCGSRRAIALSIDNPVSSTAPALTIQAARQFGRKIIRRDDETHWGALRAGATVRRELGGELYIKKAGAIFTATLLIPLSSEPPGETPCPA